MDAVNYIEKARMSLREEVEECYIRDSKSISKYPEPGNDFLWTAITLD